MVLDPELAPRDQAAWAFTREEDARAMAAFLNNQLGTEEPIAWVEFVPLARKLNENVLQYLDSWAELGADALLDEE